MESIVKGASNAPHRSLYHALGMTAEEMIAQTAKNAAQLFGVTL